MGRKELFVYPIIVALLGILIFGVVGAQTPQRMTDLAPAGRPPVEREIVEAPAIPEDLPEGFHLLEGPPNLILQNLSVVILIGSVSSDAQDVVDFLLASGHVSSVDVISIFNYIPIMPDIEGYDAVICWTDIAPLDPAALGNLLADYIDLGKGVIACEAAFTASWGLRGRFMAEYSPYTASDEGFVAVSLGTYDSDHPLMTDVLAVTDYFAFNLGLTGDAACVAWWDNDWPFVAYNSANNKVVGINAFPSVNSQWTGDLMRVILNSVLFVTESFPVDCQLSKVGTPDSYEQGWIPGDRCVTFFDPADCPGTPTYPFEITSLDFQLYLFTGSYPVEVEIVVFDMLVPDDECQGPGLELCRFSYSCDESFQYEDVGTAPFPTPCCVEGPFFIGIEYVDPVEAGLTFDQYNPVNCENWYIMEGVGWQDWNSLGYFAFWVNGETNSFDCEQDIPTLSEWGMILFIFLLLTFGTVAVIKRRKRVTAVS